MRKALGLLLLAALLQAACADTTSSSRSGVTDRASLCAMCGASVGGDYFYRTTDRGSGPGMGWD